MTEALKQRMFEGGRRACQWLRLYELDDDAAIDQLRSGWDLTDYEWTANGFASLSRSLLRALGEEVDLTLQQAHEDVAQAESSRTDSFDWAAAAEARLVIAQGLAEQKFPKQADRLRLYESTARESFNAEEPGSDVRRRLYGE